MANCRKPLACIVLIQLLAVASLGQGRAVGQREAVQSEQKFTANVQRALSELEEALALAREFDDYALRIRVQMRIADTLWKVDEERARQLFSHASSAIPSPPAAGSPTRSTGGEAYALLLDLVATTSRLDLALAESLLQKAIRGELSTPSAWQRYSGSLQLDAAHTFLGLRDPQRAARLAMAGYEGVPPDFNADQQFSSLLYSMKSNNSALSDEMFDHAISVLRRQPDRVFRSIAWMAPYIFPDFRRPITSQLIAQPPYPAGIKYLNLVHDAVAELTKSSPKLIRNSELLTALLPYFEKYAPDKRVSLDRMLDRPSSERHVPSPAAQTTVESEVREAQSSIEPRLRIEALERATTHAVNEREFDKALAIAGTISDDYTRARTVQRVHDSAASAALRSGDLEAAIRHAREVSRSDLRSAYFSRVIDALLEKKQQKQALDLLDEGWRWIQEAARGPEKVDGMLRLVGEAAVARLPGAYQMMESVIDEINLTEFAPEWQKTIRLEATDGRVMAGAEIGVRRFISNFGRSLGMLSRLDFDRALTLARKIRMKEVSVLARLDVCRDGLLNYPR